MLDRNAKVYIAGHKGLVGSALLRRFEKEGFKNIVVRTSKELDLTNQADTEAFFDKERPDYVLLAAAKVGGILANSTYPADFIYRNLMISTNVIHSAYKYGAKKLLNLGSSCIYPRIVPDKMAEDCLLTAPLEKTNEAYALAKIAAIKLCYYYNKQYGTNFISLMPTNQYGIGDNFNMETAHLLPMIMRRFHLAKLLANCDFEAIKKDLKRYKLGNGLDDSFDYDNNEEVEKVLNKLGAFKDHVVLWGDGSVFREMMSSDDLADASFYLMDNKDADEIGELVNVTDGTDIQLKDLFVIVKDIVGFKGEITYDKSKPNGTPRKLMDATKIKALGWSPKIDLKQGITDTYNWYCSL
ncbi:MAG: GDP-L-fucose synthase [Candidatus Gastranaerophilales bacterium]|nr:GDP-L-fucose synthase [Candidatus Gastranaerophilales bacterium]